MNFIFKLSTLILLIFADVYAERRKTRLVNTANGPVEGYKDQNFDIFTFHGIPYATAPVGKNKFKAPLPGPIWQETLKAVDRNIVCPQNKKYAKGKLKQEDCLIVNVYVPNINITNLPVMVHVHGGAYQMGYGIMQTPKHLVQSKLIIAVNFNYRLSVHGFLCLGTKTVPGNAGMKDQVALLQWVKKNIASFGGNPYDVTLSGSGAGSSAVDLLMLSKMARGLFNKIIPQSGANVGVWSVQLNPIKIAKDHAKKFKFNKSNSIYALENFYTNATLAQLTNEILLNPDNTFGFVPCIESKSKANNVFLHDAPVKILKSGNYKKVPILYGFSNKEGKFRRLRHEMRRKFSEYLPADLLLGNKEKEKVVKRINKLYFYSEGKNISDGTTNACAIPSKVDQCFDKEKKTDAYVDYFGDVLFVYPTLRAVKLHIKAGHDKIYLYEYSYGGGYHITQTRALMDENDENLLPKRYKKVKAIVRNIWLNFIRKGEPTPKSSKWSLPVWMRMSRSLREPRIAFWHSLYKQYYRPPAPPTTRYQTKSKKTRH